MRRPGEAASRRRRGPRAARSRSADPRRSLAVESASMSTPFEHRDAIRIVPLHGPAELAALVGDAPAAAPTRLTYRGGPLLEAVSVCTIFWGEEWQSAPNAGLIDQLNAFFTDILTSDLLDQ